jgi:hypothetical protein
MSGYQPRSSGKKITVEPDGTARKPATKRQKESLLLEVGWYRPQQRVPTVKSSDFFI